MNHQCPFCGEWVYDWFHCCEGKHKSDWIDAEYETMGWNKELKIADTAFKPLIKEE